MPILDTLEQTFGKIKQVGRDGEQLSSELRNTIKYMDAVIATFEGGMQSQEWSGNFAMYGGQDALAWGTAVYTELKTVREKLTSLDL